MITVSNVSLSFGGQLLFKDVDLKFTNGNCYGIIGANGAGKSTFLKILCGEIEPTTGEVVISKEDRLSVLRQDHFAFDEYTVLETVIMGNKRLYEIMKEKDELYAKEDFTEDDGDRAGQLESEFAELNGWEASQVTKKSRCFLHRHFSAILISSCWTSLQTTLISTLSAGLRTSSQTISEQSSSYPMTDTSLIMFVPISWISTIQR